ncbi:GAF domain-containing protein [Streptomyces sp. NPDC059556]|uniref:GAF domain-containing protein n=1 Tax=Streptomyces sp. NPDC059556 TaxID=3346863 RepID=UPI00368DBA49
MSHEHVSYLELLTRGAATEAYDRPVLLARASGAGPEALAELEEAKQLALRVRAELEGRRRREAELSALFATAHDLAGLRDLDAVLRAIVQRARALLGTECAYLSLNDPAAGDTYMRVTEGSVSARFQQLRLGMGEGLGGLVAQTARPYVTDDYFDDARFQHTRTIDTAVRDEGLVAILGVPLSLGSQVIGVLFAADRRARVFEREQVALLGSFAAHAAVAIDTANLLAETRSALAELERANDIIREHSGVIERASEVHDRLSELVLHGGGVHDVAHAVSEVLGGTVEFTEEGAGTARRAGGHAVREGDDWVAAVSAGGETLGALVLHGQPDLDPVDQRTLERAALVTSLLLLAPPPGGGGPPQKNPQINNPTPQQGPRPAGHPPPPPHDHPAYPPRPAEGPRGDDRRGDPELAEVDPDDLAGLGQRAVQHDQGRPDDAHHVHTDGVAQGVPGVRGVDREALVGEVVQERGDEQHHRCTDQHAIASGEGADIHVRSPSSGRRVGVALRSWHGGWHGAAPSYGANLSPAGSTPRGRWRCRPRSPGRLSAATPPR